MFLLTVTNLKIQLFRLYSNIVCLWISFPMPTIVVWWMVYVVFGSVYVFLMHNEQFVVHCPNSNSLNYQMLKPKKYKMYKVNWRWRNWQINTTSVYNMRAEQGWWSVARRGVQKHKSGKKIIYIYVRLMAIVQ